MPHGAREPLEDALESLKVAQRKSALPLHLEIAKAINEVARSHGLLVGKPKARPAASFPSGKRKRYSQEEIREMVSGILRPREAEGLAGKLISEECGISYQTLRKHLESLRDEGLVSRVGEGMKTCWVLK